MDTTVISQTPAASGKPHAPVTGRAVWNRADLEDRSGWTYLFTPEMLAEIDANLARLDENPVALPDMTADDFPVPAMTEMLSTVADDMGWGRGFAMLSGLPIEDYAREQASYIFYGLGAHLGIGVSQSHLGDYIGDVIDHRDPGDTRPYHNGGEFIMHRDPVDMVGLLSTRQAKSGGESRLISAAAVHNAILDQAPELLDHLYEGFPYWRIDADRGDTEKWTPYKMPIFRFAEDGNFSAHFIPNPVDRALVKEGAGPDHPAFRAVALLKELLWSRPELHIDMMIEPGDIQFVNNRLLMHGRTDYEDWDEPERQRHLLRLWMQMPNWGPPPADQLFYTNIDRAGGGMAKNPQ